MLCYDIVNPSDAATLLAPDRTIALAALTFISEGHYAGRVVARDLEPYRDESADVPIFLAGICEPYDDWWKRVGYTKEPVAAAMRDRKAAVVAALRSCQYGDLEDRRTYQSAVDAITDPDKLAAFKRAWEDRRRSSMNRIVQRAWAWADHLEKHGEDAA